MVRFFTICNENVCDVEAPERNIFRKLQAGLLEPELTGIITVRGEQAIAAPPPSLRVFNKVDDVGLY